MPRLTTSAVFAALLLAPLQAVAGKNGPPVPVRPAMGPSSLALLLEREVGEGGPVALLPDSDGLVAVGVRGGKSSLLYPGSITWVLVDAEMDLAWFGGEGRILALDLRASTQVPVEVAAGLPPDDAVAIERKGAFLTHEAPGSELWVVDLSAKGPRLSYHGGVSAEYGGYDAAGHERTALRNARVNRAWLQGARAWASSIRPAPRVAIQRHQVPGKEGGTLPAAEIPGTPLWLVQSDASCGDGCYFSHEAYDPRARQYVSLSEDSTRLDAGWVAPDGSGIVSNGQLYRVVDGAVTTARGKGGGFVRGQRELPFIYDLPAEYGGE